MKIMNVYDKNKVLVIKLGQNDVEGMLINHDLNDQGNFSFMEKEFVDEVMNCLPEYAMGYDVGTVSPMQMIPYLRETAKSVIRLKKIEQIKNYLDANTPYEQWDKGIYKIYNSKGIFSELILHFILSEFKGTIPLISKIYFRDSNAIEAHGFDAVHITTEDKKLWLGETKFYNDGKQGIRELIDDLVNHFNHDYLKEQFVVISRALVHNNEMREEWINKLNEANRLEEKLNMIVIPLLCIYEDGIADKVISAINSGTTADTLYFEHVSALKDYFDKNNEYKNKERVQVLLILLPVQSKNRIVAEMLKRIYYMQNI